MYIYICIYISPTDPMGVGKSSIDSSHLGYCAFMDIHSTLGMVHRLMLGRLHVSMEPNSSKR